MRSIIKKNYYFPYFLVLYEMSIYLSNDMYLPAINEMKQYFGTSDQFLQWTIISWMASGALTMPFLGPLCDYFGQRTVILMSGVVFLASTIGCILSPTIEIFILMRFLEGSAVSGVLVAGYGAVHENFEGKEAVSILSQMIAVVIIAPMLGPLLGGYLVELGNWKVSFYAIFALAAIAILGLYYKMPHPSKVDKNWNFSQVFRIYSELLKHSNFICGAITYGLIISCLVVWVIISPLLLMNYYEMTPKLFGWSQVPVFASLTLGSWIMNKLIDKNVSPLKVVQGGIGVMACSIMGTLLVVIFNGGISVAQLIGCMSLMSFGSGFVLSLLNRMTMATDGFSMGSKTSICGATTSLLLSVSSFLMSYYYTGTPLSFCCGLFMLGVLTLASYLVYCIKMNSLTSASVKI